MKESIRETPSAILCSDTETHTLEVIASRLHTQSPMILATPSLKGNSSGTKTGDTKMGSKKGALVALMGTEGMELPGGPSRHKRKEKKPKFPFTKEEREKLESFKPHELKAKKKYLKELKKKYEGVGKSN